MARTTEPVFRREDRGGIYYAWVPCTRTGKSVPRSTGKRTEREAVEWRRRVMRAAEDPNGHASRTVTLGDVLDEYLASRSEKRKRGKPLAPETLDFYERKCSMVATVLGKDMLASRLTAAVVDRYISVRRMHDTQKKDAAGRHTKVEDHSISKELAVLRSAFTLAKRRDRWSGDVDKLFPSGGDFSPGYDPKKAAERALSRADVARLYETMTPRKFAVLAFAIATSAEMKALQRARWEDISPDRSAVWVRGTKNDNREREAPITTLEQAMLLEASLVALESLGCNAESSTLLFSSLSNIRQDFKEAAKRAGVHHFSPHNARHTLGNWFTAAGVHSAVVGAVLGHADGRMVERTYGHLRKAADVRSAVQAQYRPAEVPLAAPRATPGSVQSAPVGFRVGIGGESGAPGDGGKGLRHHEAAIFQDVAVPTPGIEPGTRGFSIPCSTN